MKRESMVVLALAVLAVAALVILCLHGYARTRVFKAVGRGDVAAVKRYVDEGYDVNSYTGPQGTTVLHLALMEKTGDMTRIARILIDHGADIRARNSAGITPLHMAAYSGNTEIAEFLIAKGADVNARSTDGRTPLTIAVTMRSNGVAALLRRHGAK